MTYYKGIKCSLNKYAMTPRWVVHLAQAKDGTSSRGTWTSSRSGPIVISRGFTPASARFCTWIREWCQYRLGYEHNQSSSAKKILRVLMDEWLDMTWQHPQKLNLSWAAPKQRGHQGEEGDFAPLLCPCETPPSELRPVLGSLAHRPVLSNSDEV